MIQLGVSFNLEEISPEAWATRLQRLGIRVTNWPLPTVDVPKQIRDAYLKAAHQAGATIVEVGAWSNPLSKNERERQAALKRCQHALALADSIGAPVCVNIAGSRGSQWDGPDADNFSQESFDLVVESVREIIDAVKPKRAFYCLEMMPWMLPDSAESYLALIRAIDRPQFAVHLDIVNILNSPRRYFDNVALIEHTVHTLTPWIKSCHAKDVALTPRPLVHLNEVPLGQGNLSYPTLLRALSALEENIPLLLEHLSTELSYKAGLEYIQQVAFQTKILLKR